MQPPSLAHAKDTFNAFRVESVWLRTVFDTSDVLFRSGPEADALLKRTASQFFSDLNRIIVEYWILVVSRLTERAESFGRENLTAKLLIQQLEYLGLCTAEIRASETAIDRYRSLLNEARNRAISHADKETFLAEVVVGEHQEADILYFLEQLQVFNDLVGEALGEGPLDFRSTNGPGDAIDLIVALRNAASQETPPK